MSTSSSIDDVLVSIVVPCYNVERWLEACLRSILAQTHRRIEVIAVNDRSTDGTGTVLDRMAAEDARLRVIHAEFGRYVYHSEYE